MSEKIVLNTELNQTPMLTGQMIPLHEYLYENAALLPDSVRHRKNDSPPSGFSFDKTKISLETYLYGGYTIKYHRTCISKKVQ